MQDINSNAVYVQIAPDTTSIGSMDSNNTINSTSDNVKCELYWMCGIVIVSMCFAGGLGLYFLIKEH